MSRVIYYMGAGASYGKRAEDESKHSFITEGLPVVVEIPEQFAMFREYLANAEIPTSGYKTFQNMYLVTRQ